MIRLNNLLTEEDGRLNKKIKSLLEKNITGKFKNDAKLHQWTVKEILKHALTEANFHSEAKKVDKYFRRADAGSFVSGDPEEFSDASLQPIGAEIAKLTKWDGQDIINGIAFYANMNLGGGLGNTLKSGLLGEYADALEKTKEVDPDSLDESRTERSGKYEVSSKNGYVEVKYDGKVIATGDFDRGADSFFISFDEKGQKSFDDMDDILKYVKKKNITEQSKLEEKTLHRPTKRELMAVPQGSTVVVDWNGQGKVSYKVLSKNNKELKLKGMDGRKHKLPYSDYDSVHKIQENKISKSFTKAAEAYQDEQLKLQDIVDKQEDVVKKFKRSRGDEKEKLKKELIKLHRDQKEQMKKVHQAEARFEKALNNEPVELEESMNEATVAYIKFLNKDKGHKEDIKKFKGKNFYDAGQKAKKWAEKNLDSFNQDMIHYESVNMTEASMKFYAIKDDKIYKTFDSRTDATKWMRDNGDKHPSVSLRSEKDWKRYKDSQKNESTKLTDILDEIDNIKESGCGCGCNSCGGKKKLSEEQLNEDFGITALAVMSGVVGGHLVNKAIDKISPKIKSKVKDIKKSLEDKKNKKIKDKVTQISKKLLSNPEIKKMMTDIEKTAGRPSREDIDKLDNLIKKNLTRGEEKLFYDISDKMWRLKTSESVNEDTVELQRGREWDIGAGQFPTGTVFYNRAEEEHGDWKTLARVDHRGKIHYKDKKLPSFVKKHIEKYAKKKKNESINEEIKVFDERKAGGRTIIMLQKDGGKVKSAIFKNKRNADKYNRNKQEDLEKLYKLAEKTPFPKAIDEVVSEGVGSMKKDGKKLYVDSDFLNSSNKAGKLKHIGMGDFELDVDGGGTITFSRVSKEWGDPSFTGRAHEVRGDEKDIKKMLKKMPKGITQESINEAPVGDFYKKNPKVQYAIEKLKTLKSYLGDGKFKFTSKKYADQVMDALTQNQIAADQNGNIVQLKHFKENMNEAGYGDVVKKKYVNESINERVEPSDTIEKLQKIVDSSSRGRVKGTMVDLTTANIVLQVYKQANDRMKKKLNDLNVKQLISIAFKVIK